jgi:hypothetical protein
MFRGTAWARINLKILKRLHAQQPETLKHQNDEIFLVVGLQVGLQHVST